MAIDGELELRRETERAHHVSGAQFRCSHEQRDGVGEPRRDQAEVAELAHLVGLVERQGARARRQLKSKNGMYVPATIPRRQ